MPFPEQLELPVHPDRRWCAALALLSLAVCGAVGYWIARAAVPGGLAAGVGGVAVLALAVAWREMLAAASGTLVARGSSWFWRAGRGEAEMPMRVHVAIDAGAWLLLELSPMPGAAVHAARRRWIALSRRDGAPGRERWHRLRCMLRQATRAARLPQGEAAA